MREHFRAKRHTYLGGTSESLALQHVSADTFTDTFPRGDNLGYAKFKSLLLLAESS